MVLDAPVQDHSTWVQGEQLVLDRGAQEKESFACKLSLNL